MALLFDVRDHIATLTFNRPEAMNAMDPDTYRELSAAWSTVRDDPEIWVAIITGRGDRAFTAGADLKRPMGGSSPTQNGTQSGSKDGDSAADSDAWRFWQTQ